MHNHKANGDHRALNYFLCLPALVEIVFMRNIRKSIWFESGETALQRKMPNDLNLVPEIHKIGENQFPRNFL